MAGGFENVKETSGCVTYERCRTISSSRTLLNVMGHLVCVVSVKYF